jgi:restriction system protein
MAQKMWMIRAGRNAFLAQEFEDKEYVAVGWDRLGDLKDIKTKNELEKILKAAYPEDKPAQRRMSLSQLSKFRFEIKKGDLIITYNPEFRTYPVGEIISDYLYIKDSPGNYNHIRKVKWMGKINRDNFSTQTKNHTGSIATLFQIGETSVNEIMALLESKPTKVRKFFEDETEPETEDLKKETIQKSIEFIKDKLQKLYNTPRKLDR